MKKNIIIILSAVIALTVVGLGLLYYSNQAKEKAASNEQQSNTETPAKKDVREVVWGQLSERQKDEIVGTWEDGEAAKTTLNEGSVISVVGDKSYAGQEVYLISFPSKLNYTIGNVMVYADVNTFDIIGYGLRD